MRGPTVLAAAAIGLLLTGCAPNEQRAEDARSAVALAMERGDRFAALEAIEALDAILPRTPESLLEVERLRVAAGDAPRAAWALEEGTRRYPERDDLRLALADVALRLGNPSLALEALIPIAPGSQRYADALVTRSQAELQLGDLERALETLAEGERLYPDRAEVRLARITTLLAEHRRDEARAAIEDARAALTGIDARGEVSRRLEVMLAQVRAEQGESESGVEALRALLKSNPGDTLAWRALVQILAQEQRADEALGLLEESLRADEAPLELHTIAAHLYSRTGDDDAAVRELRSYIERAGSAAAYLPLVSFYSGRRDAAATREVLDRAVARFPDEPRLHLLYAEALLAEARVDAARAAFARFRELTFHGDPQIGYLRARIELATGDASAAARRLSELAPRLDRATTQYWLGRALEATGDWEGARRRYGLAQARDPSELAPTEALIALEQQRGAWGAVAGHARQLVLREPGRFEGWRASVIALENLGDGEAAERVANGCLERFPDRAEAHMLLARALRAQRRYDDALEAIAAAESRGGPDVQTAAERAITLGMANRVDEGIAIAREALASNPDAAALHAAQAALLYAHGAAEQGALATDRALALEPEEPRPLRVRCDFRASIGQWDAARADCERYLSARPRDARVHFTLGVILQSIGDRNSAIAAYRRASELDERDARALNNLAVLLAADDDLEGALAAAQEAYRRDEANPYVMDTLAELYLRNGLTERAISLLEDARAAAPELHDATLHLALAYRDSGRKREARALLADLKRGSTDDAAMQGQIEEALHSLQ